ncbi:MAG: 5-oxoprolinase subunit PxpB [Synergistaceae bacterium]|nr:5-oxoprolinase subunit PxpB [Synergistaceae bacterium]
MYDSPRFLGLGEGCLIVEFSDRVEMEANVRLQELRRALSGKMLRGLIECAPAYRSLSIHHDPLTLARGRLEEIVRAELDRFGDVSSDVGRSLVLPVAYGGEFGPDMRSVSEHTGLDEEEIISRHTARECYCYMLGFTPGFGYLGGMDESLATPRLESPRTLILAGSVGIAGVQTGAYSVDGPGGWRLIGRTPLRLFDPEDGEKPTLLDAGDRVRFRRISEMEYDTIKRDVTAHRYVPERGGEGRG